MRRVASAAIIFALAGCGGAATKPATAPRAFEPAAPTPAPKAERPVGRHLTAALTRRTRLFAQPGGRVVSVLGRRTEFGSQTVLAVVRWHGAWLKVAAAQLPNGHRGWIRRAHAVLGATDYDIRVDRSAHRAALRHDGRVLLRFPVAVGRPGNETPLGRYAVTDKLRPVEATSPYGCCALALTGHQTQLEPGWPGGDRLAIHGTPATWSIGQAVSLGCMRAPTKALHVLMRRVPLGAPVVVRA
jgi:lipoprotein-anchoring transpeptidase ErfK/SrfK